MENLLEKAPESSFLFLMELKSSIGIINRTKHSGAFLRRNPPQS